MLSDKIIVRISLAFAFACWDKHMKMLLLISFVLQII